MEASYDEKFSRRERKASGVYYTPDMIVKYILNQTLARHDVLENPEPAILDPACGSGNFLVASYELLFDKFNATLLALSRRYDAKRYLVNTIHGQYYLSGEQYWQVENLHYHIVTNCLFGADIDEDSVDILKSRLWAKQLNETKLKTEFNIICCDSLVKWENCSDCGNFGAELRRFWSRQYDYVIGNPPYISFGLNRTGKMAASQAATLRANYPRSAQYKLSYYALFFERSINRLKRDGYLGFVTPDSFLIGRYFSKLREFILAQCRIEQLIVTTSKIFGSAQVGTPVISILGKTQEKVENNIVCVAKLDAQGEAVGMNSYEQEYFENQVYNRFRLFFDKRDKRIVEKMERAPLRLGGLAKVRTGMRSLTTQADIKSKSALGPNWLPGLVSSSQVLPFVICYEGDWLNVDPDKLNKGGWDQTVMAGEKIFLRQTGDSLVAAVDKSGLFHLNNIHSVAVADSEDLYYLVCLLNSRLLNYYYHTVTLERGRILAQVDIEMVEKLPISMEHSGLSKLTSIGRRLTDIVETYPRSCRYSELVDLCSQMDKLVYNIYGLTDDEITHVEQVEPNSFWTIAQRKRGRR